MNYDVIIAGGGIAGLTAAAFLSRSGLSVLLCEKDGKVGGHVNSFYREEFLFDGGIRAMENSGILFPMLADLGISVDFIKSSVSIGLSDDIVNVDSKASLDDYQQFLERQFPENRTDAAAIIREIRKIMKYMDVLYGIDNPVFLDLSSKPGYVIKTILPWLVRYIFTIKKIMKLNQPVNLFLEKLTSNQQLIDMIAQHFFTDTPTFFAMSYFSLYLDYSYPRGGTGKLIEAVRDLALRKGAEIRTGTSITAVDLQRQSVSMIDSDGKTASCKYAALLWAADLKTLYTAADIDMLPSGKQKVLATRQRESVLAHHGGDSVFTLFSAVDLPPSYFEEKTHAHLFYTPEKKGLSVIDGALKDEFLRGEYDEKPEQGRQIIMDWVEKLLSFTTYEISIPALRDESLAPPGKTGLIISLLLDYMTVKKIELMGWYDEFKQIAEQKIIKVLDASIFPGFEKAQLFSFSSSPLTLERRTGNSEGAITGWAFNEGPLPVESRMQKIFSSVYTPLPHIFQAGQWAFSPSGLPISIFTGKIAADKIIKEFKKGKGAF